MLFSSISFLYFFLPVTAAFYFAVPNRSKNIVLLAASLFFYFWGEPAHLFLLLFSALSGYIHGLLIDRLRGTVYARVTLVSSIVVSLGLLGYFKYGDFLIRNINALMKTGISPLGLTLPIGISFYTFQVLSYTIDVYRHKVKVQRNFIRFATYVSLFPQLIAGPIVRYETVEEELACRRYSWTDISYGAGRFSLGLARKCLIANTLGQLIHALEKSGQMSVVSCWIKAIAFTLQIYHDFAGYSDMAIGLGRIFGFHFEENFDYPYVSKSISEFWRRWHISLGSWFRDYVYIPLGGNRCSDIAWVFNVLTVWFLTGMWHGAQWNFIVWGLYFAFFLLMEKLFLGKVLRKAPGAVCHVYVLFFVLIGFVIFDGDGMGNVMVSLQRLFGGGKIPAYDSFSTYYLTSYRWVLVFAAAACTPVFRRIKGKMAKNVLGCRIIRTLEPFLCMGLLVLATASLVDGSFNPFLYFRF